MLKGAPNDEIIHSGGADNALILAGSVLIKSLGGVETWGGSVFLDGKNQTSIELVVVENRWTSVLANETKNFQFEI